MESEDKVELISLAIQKLIEEKKKNKDSSAHDDQLMLSDLLSQLESLKRDEASKQSGGVAEPEKVTSPAVGEAETKDENAGNVDGEDGREEIVNELRRLKRQNFMTHCLLSVMIVLTVAWQLSEVKLILLLKDGVTHPFRSAGSMFMGMLRRRRKYVEQKYQSQIEALPLPSLKIPELPNIADLAHMDLRELRLDGETLNQLNHYYGVWNESKNGKS